MKATSLTIVLALAAGCAHPDRRTVPLPPPAAPRPAGAPTGAPAAGATPPGVAAFPVTLAAGGDVMLGTTFPDETGGLLPPDDGRTLLAEVTPALSGADLALVNLEGPLIDGGVSEKCKASRTSRCWAFRSPERYGALLRAAGVDVVSLANNHVGDFGEEGCARTRAVLDANGIAHSGGEGEMARLAVRGARVAVVAFATTPGTNDLRDLEGAVRLVQAARRDADLVVVSMHGGAEGADRQHVPEGDEQYLGEDRGDLRAFAHAMVDAGAAVVIGHGPHVVRGAEIYRGRLVAYSLGNLATYGGMRLDGPNGVTLVLEVRLAADGAFLGGRVHPMRQEKPGGPRRDPAGEVIPLLRRLSQEDFGERAVRVADDGALSPP